MTRSRLLQFLAAPLAALVAGGVAWWHAPPRPGVVLALGGVPWKATFSPKGDRVTAVVRDSSSATPVFAVGLWDTASGEVLREFRRSPEPVCSVVFSPDGRSVAVATFRGRVTVWDADGGKELADHRLPPLAGTGDAVRLAFDPAGRLVATSVGPRLAVVRDALSGEVLARVDPPPGSDFRNHSTDNLLAAADGDGLHLYGVASGAALANVPCDPSGLRIKGYAPAPGLLSVADGNRVQVCDLATGEFRTLLSGGDYRSASLSPDGELVAVGLGGSSGRLSGWWDKLTAADSSAGRGAVPDELRVYFTGSRLPRARIPGCSVGTFSPDGSVLAAVRAEELALYAVPFNRPLGPALAAGSAAGGLACLVLYLGSRRRRATPLASNEPAAGGQG